MSGDPLSPTFDGRVVVVTGVGRAGQLGEVVARDFGRRGARLAVIDLNPVLANERASALQAEGFDATPYGCDLTDPATTGDTFRRIAALGGGHIDALANVAGGFASSGPVADSDPAILTRQIAINLGSAYGATRACLPFLRAARGSIVYMTSAAALPEGSAAGISAYVASKAGVLALMRAVAQEELQHGVRANALAPTAIRTSANLTSMGDRFPYVEREAVATLIVFLCSPAAVNVNGQVFRLA